MISIVIPTLNEESVLEKTLINLKRITSMPYEIIISDGRSTDRTIDIAKNYADQITVYRGEARQTIAGGRNMGATAARGDYLISMDSDVIIPFPDAFLQKAVKIFETDSRIGALTVSQKVVSELETWSDRLIFKLVNCVHFLNNNILKTGSSSGEFQMIRASVFKEMGGYNEMLAVFEDNEMFMRIAKKYKTRMVLDLVVFHTGRRAHKIGWPRLLWQWTMNALSVMLFKRAASREWKVIR